LHQKKGGRYLPSRLLSSLTFRTATGDISIHIAPKYTEYFIELFEEVHTF
jgi:hypothetical protein